MRKALVSALLGSAAAFFAVSGAGAADLPSRAPPPIIAAVPIFTWTGFYVGLNAGYGFGTNDDAFVILPNGVPISTGGGDNGGFVGGGQVGYNYQIGQFVIGLEADIQYADMTQDAGTFFLPGTALFGVGGGSSLDYFGTIRARAGFAFDRALIYATGGFAYGGGDRVTCSIGVFFADCGDDSSTGWTVGGGVEYAITNNFTVKLEGLYVNLDRGGNDVFDPITGVIFPAQENIEFGVVRAGLNYKF